MGTKLYVGNLSYQTSEEELRRLFGAAGEVTSVSIVTDRDTGRSRGFAFVEMGSEEAAREAIRQLNGQRVDDRELTVNEARPRESRGSGGGYGGGGGQSRRDDRGRGRY